MTCRRRSWCCAASPARAAAAAADASTSAPGEHAQRVLSAEERASLSPEAWGYLLRLRAPRLARRGQFERVLDLLSGSGVRPVGVELAREVATRVALDAGRPSDPGEIRRMATSNVTH